MNWERALTVLGSAVATAALGYFGLAKPAVDERDAATSSLELAHQLLIERDTTLQKREAQLERREARIDTLKQQLEACEAAQ